MDTNSVRYQWMALLVLLLYSGLLLPFKFTFLKLLYDFLTCIKKLYAAEKNFHTNQICVVAKSEWTTSILHILDIIVCINPVSIC